MNDIIGFDACAAELKRLVAEIRANLARVESEATETRVAAVNTEARKLVDYTNRTEPADYGNATEVEGVRSLDRQAMATNREIRDAALESLIHRIDQRAAEINDVVKAFKQQTAENEKKARSLRLVPLRNVVDRTTELVVAIREAKDVLLDGDVAEAELKKKLESALKALEGLRTAANGL